MVLERRGGQCFDTTRVNSSSQFCTMVIVGADAAALFA
jgi:hypothetical protein